MTRPAQAARALPRERERVATIALAAFAAAGTMVIAVTLPAAGQTASRPVRDDAVIQTAASGNSTDARESYRSRVRDEMAEWRRKMQAFGQKVEAGSGHRLDAAEATLRAAWDDAEVEARNVQAADGRGWERAKTAYEIASRKMAAAWDKVRL